MDTATYAYREQDSAAGQGHYDAWLVTEFPDVPADGQVVASSRSDVLAWLTGFRQPEHPVYGMDGHLISAGQHAA
jgi:hypothetical protein